MDNICTDVELPSKAMEKIDLTIGNPSGSWRTQTSPRDCALGSACSLNRAKLPSRSERSCSLQYYSLASFVSVPPSRWCSLRANYIRQKLEPSPIHRKVAVEGPHRYSCHKKYGFPSRSPWYCRCWDPAWCCQKHWVCIAGVVLCVGSQWTGKVSPRQLGELVLLPEGSDWVQVYLKVVAVVLQGECRLEEHTCLIAKMSVVTKWIQR